MNTELADTRADRRLVRRVVLKNYKSIAACDVSPGQICFLVGPNGSGKSNFLDALRFVADALRSTLDHALRDRGGINEVRRRSSGHPTHFGVRLELVVSPTVMGSYSFVVGAKSAGAYLVQREECLLLETTNSSKKKHYYKVREGRVIDGSIGAPPAGVDDRL